MKKLSLILSLFMGVSLISYAQINKEEIEYFQSIFGMEKKALVADFIKLEGE